MTRVKICGIKNMDDIVYVNNHLPDYVGFVFAKSKRKVSLLQAEKLIINLDPRIHKVGVFVNEDLMEVINIVKKLNLNIIQLHGDEDDFYIESLKKDLDIEIWKAVRVKNKESLKQLNNYSNATAFLLDTFNYDVYGGTGKQFDWNIALEAKKFGKIVLAGGLNVGNVQRAIKLINPYVVDVSSGVENELGKDEIKVKKFIYSARSNIY